MTKIYESLKNIEFSDFVKNINNNLDEKDIFIYNQYYKYLFLKNCCYIEITEKIFPEFSNLNIDLLNLCLFNSSIIEKNIIDINIKSYQAQLIYTTGNLFIEYIQKFKKNKNKKLNPDKIICEIIDLKKNTTIYGEAYNNNINFILNLHYKSFLYQYFIQFDSSAQINLKNEKEKSCLISLLTQNQIKFDLLKALNPFIIRIDFKTKYKACTFLDCPISIFNEKIIFKKKLKNEEIFLNSDRLYQKRTILSFLFKHERMTHVKKILNKSEIDFEKSPTIYYNFEKNKYFLLKTIEGIHTINFTCNGWNVECSI